MASRTYDIELECGCMLSADGGGGLIPCEGGYLLLSRRIPIFNASELEARQHHIRAWAMFRESGEMREYDNECERRNS